MFALRALSRVCLVCSICLDKQHIVFSIVGQTDYEMYFSFDVLLKVKKEGQLTMFAVAQFYVISSGALFAAVKQLADVAVAANNGDQLMVSHGRCRYSSIASRSQCGTNVGSRSVEIIGEFEQIVLPGSYI